MRLAELRVGQPLHFHGKHRVRCVSTRLGTSASPFKTTLLWACRELPASLALQNETPLTPQLSGT